MLTTEPLPPMDKALHIVAQHLRHAQRSHEQAQHLRRLGQTQAACEQNRMTRVFLHNALHHINQHTPEE